MQTILIVFHLFLAIGLIGLILIQHGKGADMGAAFGSGASGTVFGAKGSASFLTRMTAGLATLFFITSMAMAYFASQRDEGSDLIKGLQQQAPAATVEKKAETDVPPIPAATTDMPPVDTKETPVPAPASPESASEVPAAPVSTSENSAPAQPQQPAEATPAEQPAQPAEGKSQ
ncbi:MAG: preprotein translocase subunit SecG [Candidatus Thiodiazotropha sp.]